MVSRVAVALVLVAAGLAGCADGGGPEADGGRADGATMRGVVVDQAIRPLAGALVRAVGGGLSLNSTTGADGLFNFTGLVPGVYVLTVSKAFYSTQQLTAQVSGRDEALVKVELTLESGTLPFANLVKWEGFLECSASIGNWCGIANLYPCIVQSQLGQPCTKVSGDNSFNYLQEFFTDLQRSPDWMQIEAYWESTQSVSRSLSIRYAATNQSEWDRFSFGPVLGDPHGPSPLIATVNATAMADAELGTTRGLTTELFHGAPDAVPPFPPPFNGAEQLLGVAANQRITILYIAFYGYVPPEGWTFVETGAVPPP